MLIRRQFTDDSSFFLILHVIRALAFSSPTLSHTLKLADLFPDFYSLYNCLFRFASENSFLTSFAIKYIIF